MITTGAFMALCGLLLSAAEAPPVVVGNGRLSAAMTHTGVSMLHWETTHAQEALRWRLAGGPESAAEQTPSITVWDTELPVFQATIAASSADPEIGIIAFVHPLHDVLAVQITMHTPAPDQHLIFESDLAPAARYPVPAAGLLSALQPQVGFATFAADNAQRVYRFRPAGAGLARRAMAAATATVAARQWPRMEGGAWLAYASAEASLDVQTQGLLLGAGAGTMESGPLVVVPAANEDGPRRRYLLFLAFGHSKDAVDAQLDAVTAQGFEVALEATRTWWRERLRGARLLQRLPGAAPLLRHSMQDLLLCAEPISGAVLDAPLAPERFPHCQPRDAAWIIEALHRAALPEAAGSFADFLLRAMDTGSNAVPLEGALPAALHGDGSAALPGFIVDAGAVAWSLLGAWRHLSRLDVAARAEFLRPHTEAVRAARAFLVAWRMADGLPAPSYDPVLGRDHLGETLFFELWLGLTAAEGLAAAAGLPPGESARRRQDELLTRMKFERINRGAPLAVSFDTAYWLHRVAPEQRELWNMLVRVEGHGTTPEGPAWRLNELLGARALAGFPEARRAALRLLAVSDQLDAGS